jgi:hypothetical protein
MEMASPLPRLSAMALATADFALQPSNRPGASPFPTTPIRVSSRCAARHRWVPAHKQTSINLVDNPESLQHPRRMSEMIKRPWRSNLCFLARLFGGVEVEVKDVDPAA